MGMVFLTSTYVPTLLDYPGVSRVQHQPPPPPPPSPVQVTKTPGLENLLSFRVKVNFEGR